jgi:predicted RNA-binding protein YlxR (DUF448 family)
MKGQRPQRTCLGCGARDDQGRLIRLIVADQGDLKISERGSGRGGYLHRGEACWRAFLRTKSLHRAFHAEISKGTKEKLVQELKERIWE